MCWEYKAKVISAYDGDTLRATLDLPLNCEFETTFRLVGIDTPELRGDEREAGIISRDVLRDKILDKNVTVITEKDKTGKYGRYLCAVFYRNQNINEFLLKEGYAKVY
jgi:micrococcal nuclease